MAKIVIADDNWEGHGEAVQTVLLSSYNTAKNAFKDWWGLIIGAPLSPSMLPDLTSDNVVHFDTFENAVAYCQDNADAEILVCSDSTDVSLVTDYAELVYSQVLTVMPLGSNTFELLTKFTTAEPPIIATCGAGSTKNNTGYGNGLEFWDDDGGSEGDLSSFSTGVIAGKLLAIKHALNYRKIGGISVTITWWHARFVARLTATQTEDNRVYYGWDQKNGYGQINADKAYKYKGMLPLDIFPEYVLEETYDAVVADLAAANATIATLQSHEAYFDESNIRTGFVVNIDTDYGVSEFALLSTYELKDDSKLHATLKLYKDLTSYTAGKEPLHTIIYRCASTQTLNNILYQFLKVNVSALTSGTFNLVAV